MFLAELLDLIAPLACLGCFRRLDQGKIFAGNLNHKVNICPTCALEFQFPFWQSSLYENTWTMAAYQGVAREVINRIKETNDEQLLGFLLDNCLSNITSLLEELADSSTPVALIPAPSRRTQAMIDIPLRICEQICVNYPSHYKMFPIMRLDGQARDSAGLTKIEREKNIAQHLYFTIPLTTIFNQLHDAIIVMLDDVITSGATVHSVKKALARCHISLDTVITICHA